MARASHPAIAMFHDARRPIARLAAAVMAADARITPDEVAALPGLERLGLGALEALTREELLRSAREPIDLRATCAELGALAPEAAAVVLSVLAEIAASDGRVDAREAQLLAGIGSLLRLPPGPANRILSDVLGRAAGQEDEAIGRSRSAADGAPEAADDDEPVAAAATVAPADPARAAAFAALGLAPGATRAAVDAAYRAIIERYQPIKVIDLGPEFAALAVQRLAAATAAYAAAAGSESLIAGGD
jgi:DnaJ-domain-containing protein 1